MTIDGENALKKRKISKKPKLELLDNTLWMWFCQERRKGTPISGPIIKEKAIALHKKLEAGSEFTASESWIDRWKTHHGVWFVSISEEKLSADAEAAKKLAVKFREIVEQYELLPCQVYNIDETGLNYKMLPKKTFASSNETVAGTKFIKNRLTIPLHLTATLMGHTSFPYSLLVNLRSLGHSKTNLSSLPVYYHN